MAANSLNPDVAIATALRIAAAEAGLAPGHPPGHP